MTVRENLDIGAYILGKDRQRIQAAIERMVATFPVIGERMNQLAGTMSGGEQQMLAIARALMAGPTAIILDEPSLGLSPRLVKENFNIIRQINERGITVLLVEQNVHQTLAISHFGFVISKGRVATSGTPAELAGRSEVRDAYFG
jgi:branched-chain amino acid transport system ATP-binding protein